MKKATNAIIPLFPTSVFILFKPVCFDCYFVIIESWFANLKRNCFDVHNSQIFLYIREQTGKVLVVWDETKRDRGPIVDCNVFW